MVRNTWSIAVVLAAFLLTPTVSQAQQWSAEEQEVLTHVKECFASFTEATEKKDLQIWVQRCRPTDESLFWWAPDTGPQSLQTLSLPHERDPRGARRPDVSLPRRSV